MRAYRAQRATFKIRCIPVGSTQMFGYRFIKIRVMARDPAPIESLSFNSFEIMCIPLTFRTCLDAWFSSGRCILKNKGLHGDLSNEKGTETATKAVDISQPTISAAAAGRNGGLIRNRSNRRCFFCCLRLDHEVSRRFCQKESSAA